MSRLDILYILAHLFVFFSRRVAIFCPTKLIFSILRVIPLHKSGPRNLFNNYRPVSILFVISKVFEKLLYEQLYDYFVSNNLLSDSQFDFALTASGESVLDAEVTLQNANIKQWLSASKLSLNLVKTEYLLIRLRHSINNLFHAPKVHVGDIPVKRVKETKALGVYIYEFLSWNKHIEVISKKISSGIWAIRKLKPHVDHNTLICAYIVVKFGNY